MPGGGKRQKELQRKKRLEAKHARLASRSAERRADQDAAAHVEGPRCGFCGGPMIRLDPETSEPLPQREYGGHPICESCWESVPRLTEE